MTQQPLSPTTDSLADLLEAKGINVIAIIDDVYDPPTIDDLDQDAIEQFRRRLRRDKNALTELRTIFSDENNLDPVDDLVDQLDAVVSNLWDKRDELQTLGLLCKETLFREKLQDYEQVKKLHSFLEQTLGRKVICLGVSARLEDLPEERIELIFIDYYLGQLNQDTVSSDTLQDGSASDGLHPAVQTSIDFAKRLYNKYVPEEQDDASDPFRPLIILMSSRTVTKEMRAQFRNHSKLLEGMFQFVSKEEFYHPEQLSLRLRVFTTGIPLRHKIQYFMDALERAIKDTTDKFLLDIRELSLDDYAYIQKLSLQEDGHPLGDYMLWLYSAYFGHLLFEAEPQVRKHRAIIDKLTFDGLPPTQAQPSSTLVEIYKSALFDMHVGEITKHPHDEASEEEENNTEQVAKIIPDVAIPGLSTPTDDSVQANIANSIREQPHLHLGDLFIDSPDREIFMIINAQCDLEFAPRNPGRPFDPKQSILLMPGYLRQLHEVSDYAQAKAKTELFAHEGKSYRIIWNPKRVRSMPYGEIWGWLDEQGYSRKARMRLPYALDMQRVFTVDLTRIGMPVSPPISQPVKIQLYTKGDDGNHVALLGVPREQVATIAITKQGEQCFLTSDCVILIMSEIDRLVRQIEAKQAQLNLDDKDDNIRWTRAEKRKNFLLLVREKRQEWFNLLQPFSLSLSEDAEFPELSLRVCRDRLIQGRYSYAESILVHVTST